MANNFNCNSRGLAIELFVQYDNDQSQQMFDENFTHIKDNIYWYDTWNSIQSPDSFSDLYEIIEPNKEISYEILINNFNYDLEELEEDNWEKDRIWEEVIDNYSFPENLDYFIEMINDYHITHTALYEVVYSRGYSQGDYAEIFVPIELREVYGLADDVDLVDNVKEDIDHFLWDSPLYCRITINDREYYSETFDGSYEYFNRNIFIKEILAEYKDDGLDMDLLKEELEILVPDEPT